MDSDYLAFAESQMRPSLCNYIDNHWKGLLIFADNHWKGLLISAALVYIAAEVAERKVAAKNGC